MVVGWGCSADLRRDFFLLRIFGGPPAHCVPKRDSRATVSRNKFTMYTALVHIHNILYTYTCTYVLTYILYIYIYTTINTHAGGTILNLCIARGSFWGEEAGPAPA